MLIARIFCYVVPFLAMLSYSPSANADCSDAISTTITVDVPVRSNNIQRAPIVSGAISDQMESSHPQSARCGTVVYSIRVTIKAGLYLIPLLPLAGEIKEDELWKDLLPSLVRERLGVDDVTGSNFGQDGCGDGCQRATITGMDSLGTLVNVTITYWATFSCVGSNCTLTLTLLDTTYTLVSDGSPYFGPGVLVGNDEAADSIGEV